MRSQPTQTPKPADPPITLGEFAILRAAQRIRAFGIKDGDDDLRILEWDKQIRAQIARRAGVGD